MEPLNILVVEDDRSQRILLEKTLRYSRTVNIFMATSVSEAREILNTQPIDGAVLDLVLQQGSGLEVATLCKERHIPVVFHTSSHDPHNLGLMYEYGFVISKPAFLSSIARVLEYFDCWSYRKGI